MEVRKCITTAVDETLHTVDMFLIDRENSNMDWSETIYNFSNCLGNTARLRLQKVKKAVDYWMDRDFERRVEESRMALQLKTRKRDRSGSNGGGGGSATYFS